MKYAMRNHEGRKEGRNEGMTNKQKTYDERLQIRMSHEEGAIGMNHIYLCIYIEERIIDFIPAMLPPQNRIDSIALRIGHPLGGVTVRVEDVEGSLFVFVLDVLSI